MKKSKVLTILIQFYSFKWLSRMLSLPFRYISFNISKRFVTISYGKKAVLLSAPNSVKRDKEKSKEKIIISPPEKLKIAKTYFVYILRSLKNGKFYIGTTEDLYACFNRHNSGENISTFDQRPFELIYYEASINYFDAKEREKYLRSNAGQKFLKKRLQKFLNHHQPSNIQHILKIASFVSVVIIMLIIPAVAALLLTPQFSNAAWFNESWLYRKSLTFTHNAALTNRQVQFSIATSTLISNGQMQSDCGDSRFTDSNGNIIAYYLVSGCNTGATLYNVYIPVVNNGTTVIYHYYGNPSAPNGTAANPLPFTSLSPSGGAATAGSEEKGPGPIIYWKLDEGANTTAYDSSSHNYTGTIIGGTWKSGQNCVTGTCLYVDDTSQQGITADPAPLSKLTTGTISVWARYTGENRYQDIFNIYRSADTTGTGIGLSFDNQISGGVNIHGGGLKDGSTKWEFTLSSSYFNAVNELNKWHLYTLSHDGTTPTLYIDGKLMPITFTTSTDKTVWFKGVLTDATSPADALSVGILYANSTPFDNATAFFDDFKIYPYNRSSSQIASDFNSRGSSKGSAVTIGNVETKYLTEGLVGYWNMDNNWGGNLSTLPAVTGGSAGLTGDYYDGISFSTYINTYTDATVDFDPAETVLGTNRANGDTTFSVGWTGEVKASYSETYTFYVTSDDGTKLYVNNTQLINAWVDQAPTENSGTIALTANTWYPITLNFYQNGGGAAIQLSYSSASEAKKIIPSTNLRTVTRAAGSCSSIPDGPTDYSGNGNNLVHNSCNPASNYNGKFDYAGRFTRSIGTFNSGYDSNTLSVTGDLTLSAWIKPNFATPSSQMDITGKWDGSNQSYLLAQYGNEVRMYLDAAGNYVTTSGAGIVTNTWNHVVGTYNATRREAKIFVNGKEQTTTLTGIIPSSIGDDASVYSIGAENTTTTAANAFDGYIDDVRLYKRTLSPSEIRQLYSWAPGPVGWWKFDENTGSTFFDSSGNDGYNGVLETDSYKWVIGKYGPAINFLGTSGKGYIPNTDTTLNEMGLKQQSYTLEAWINPTNANSESYILTKGQNSWGNGNIQYAFYSNLSTGKLYVDFEILDGTNWPGVGGTAIPASYIPVNTWTHVVGVRDAEKNTLRLYVNGILVDEQTDTTTNTTANGESLIFANRPGSDSPFVGSLDDVKLYNYARSSSQIIEDMNGGHPIGGSPVGSQLIYTKFDEQNGTTINNSGFGGSTYNGTLTGPTWLENTRCKTNGCLNFDTTTDTVSFGDVSFVDGMASVSASFWVNPQVLSTNKMIVSKANNTTQRVFQIKTDDSSSSELKVMIAANATDTTNYCVTSGFGLAANSWQHIVVAYDGGQTNNNNKVIVYKNGRPYTCSGTLPNALVSGTTSNFKLGQGDDATPTSLIMFLDEFKLYTSTLTQDQVNIDFNQGASLNFNTGTGIEASQSGQVNESPPIGYWNFDQNKGVTAKDISGNGLDGTLNNSPKWIVGNVGAGIVFDGVDDEVNIGTPGTLSNVSPLTASAWIYPRSLGEGTFGRIIDKTTSTVPDNGWEFALNSSSGNTMLFSVDFSLGNLTVVAAANTITLNRWQYVTVTWDGSTTATNIHMYVNGKETGYLSQTNGSGSRVTDASSSLRIGNDSTGTRTFDGIIDDVKIYNYVRSQSQIDYDYNRGAPVGWWKFDECQGSTAYDSSGFGKNGTINPGASGNTAVGTCISGTSTHMWYNGVTGKFNSSIDLDGTDDYINVPSPNLPTGDFTYSAWVNLDTVTDERVFMIADGSGGNEFDFDVGNSGADPGKVCVEVNGAGCDVVTTNSVSASTWTNITVTRSGGTIIVYINGNADPTTGSDSATLSFSTCDLLIGTDADSGCTGSLGNYLNGRIDDARIYNYALTPIQVRKLYTDGSTVYFGPATGSP